ncbi:MAG: hypothetical protein LBP75_08035 [Planctomycetota bacterium]|jgi:hypothetical protein|nr:hypothetical protein [Planctomycetota bacterium]
MADVIIEEIHQIRREMVKRWKKMTAAEARADFQKDVDEGLQAIARARVKRQKTNVG